MRVQLLTDHTFAIGGGTICLKEGSILGAEPGDFPLSEVENFFIGPYMKGLDPEGRSIVRDRGGPQYVKGPAPPGEGPVPPSWSAPIPVFMGGTGSNYRTT